MAQSLLVGAHVLLAEEKPARMLEQYAMLWNWEPPREKPKPAPQEHASGCRQP